MLMNSVSGPARRMDHRFSQRQHGIVRGFGDRTAKTRWIISTLTEKLGTFKGSLS